MKRVPDTSFQVSEQEWKLVMNLIEGATKAVKMHNKKAVLRDVAELKTIMAKWPVGSLASHMRKRVDELWDKAQLLKEKNPGE